MPHLTPSASPPARSFLPGKPAGLLLGVGLGGFVDGIVLHQILQWLRLVSHVDGLEPNTERFGVNTVADGFFHLLAWGCVISGSTLAIWQWRMGRLAPSWCTYFGLVVAGWGAFNLVEGGVNPWCWKRSRWTPGTRASTTPAALSRGRRVAAHLGPP